MTPAIEARARHIMNKLRDFHFELEHYSVVERFIKDEIRAVEREATKAVCEDMIAEIEVSAEMKGNESVQWDYCEGYIQACDTIQENLRTRIKLADGGSDEQKQ